MQLKIFEIHCFDSVKKIKALFAAALFCFAAVVAAQEQKVTLTFKNADVKKVLSQLADLRGKNIVFTDAVTGRVTIELKDVPVDRAMETVLRQMGLRQEENDGIIIVKPLFEYE